MTFSPDQRYFATLLLRGGRVATKPAVTELDALRFANMNIGRTPFSSKLVLSPIEENGDMVGGAYIEYSRKGDRWGGRNVRSGS